MEDYHALKEKAVLKGPVTKIKIYVKIVLSKTISKSDKYKLLTTLPLYWSAREIHKELNVTIMKNGVHEQV